MCMLKYFSTKALSNDVLELGKKTRNFSEMYKVSKERDSNGMHRRWAYIVLCPHMLLYAVMMLLKWMNRLTLTRDAREQHLCFYFPNGLIDNILIFLMCFSSLHRSHLYLQRGWFLPAMIQYLVFKDLGNYLHLYVQNCCCRSEEFWNDDYHTTFKNPSGS